MTDRLPPLALPDLTGRTALVTSGTSGLGLETATALVTALTELPHFRSSNLPTLGRSVA